MRALIITKSITNRDHSSIDKYFNEISRFPLISAREEAELSRRIKSGDAEALTRLVNANLRFVVSVSKQYQHQGVSLGDLINEGNLGLVTAARRFDESKGFKFISYAVWWIRQSITFAIAEQSRIVHLPYNHVTMLSKLSKVHSGLEQKNGRPLSVEELAEDLDVSVEKIAELMSYEGRKVSLDQPLSSEGEATLLDTIQVKDSGYDRFIFESSITKDVKRSMAFLSKREQNLISSYFGLNAGKPLTLEEIAKAHCLSVEHVRRLKDAALARIRNSSNARLLQSYL
jgi:RNA polymerase primary sigma factor